METEHYYEVEINWESGQKGTISSPVLKDTVEVATPPEFANGIEGVWSPEHLFVSAVSSCFMTTFLAIAENSKLDFKSLKIKSAGKLEKVDGKFMMSEVMLKPVLTIPAETDPEKAERILHKSDRACLISNSVRSNIVLEPEVIVK